ncbi:MAG: hypothetical protein Kow0088_06740 [Anaerolineales bacterium]
MKRRNENVVTYLLLLCFVVLTQAPYLFAYSQSDQMSVFSGFLFNPLDGNTYLSKIRQGWEGNWLFELTYSPENSKPAFLFVFYLLLGHIARVLHWDLIFTFHFARLGATICLFGALKQFFQWVMGEQKKIILALFWVMFGGGLGWLAVLFGGFTPDFWVAEGYVFLSAFANPHFPLSIALMLWVLTLSSKALEGRGNSWTALMGGLVLANLSPFAWIIATITLAAYIVCTLNSEDPMRKIMMIKRLVFFGLGGSPFLLYQLWIMRQDVVLGEWNRQNVTPSPTILNFVMGFLPLGVWSFLGAIRAYKKKDVKELLPLLWIAISVLLVFIPSPLQRRFMIGMYIPLVVLTNNFLHEVFSDQKLERRDAIKLWMTFSLILSFLTNVILLSATFRAILQRDSSIFLYRDETKAYQWLSEHSQSDAVVLASPASGMYIPARTGLRVVYGHPFESIHAQQRMLLIENFYQGKMSPEEQRKFLTDFSIKFILWGYREQEIANPEVLNSLKQTFPIAYHSGKITIFRVSQ